MLLNQKITIEFTQEQAHEFLSLFRKIKKFIDVNGLQISSPKYMNIEEAADYIDRPKSYLYGQTHKNQISHIKKGRKLYFRKDDLDKFLEAGKREPLEKMRQ